MVTSKRSEFIHEFIVKKGYDAPDDNPSKASMGCDLVVCLASYGSREEKYSATNKRSTNRRRGK